MLSRRAIRFVSLLRNLLLFKPANAIPAISRLVYAMANRKRPLRAKVSSVP